MKPPYSYYTDGMWRYFFERQRREQDGAISPYDTREVEMLNYSICLEVWKGLSETERAIIKASTRSDWANSKRLMEQLAGKLGLPIGQIWDTAHTINKTTAIKRGLINP